MLFPVLSDALLTCSSGASLPPGLNSFHAFVFPRVMHLKRLVMECSRVLMLLPSRGSFNLASFKLVAYCDQPLLLLLLDWFFIFCLFFIFRPCRRENSRAAKLSDIAGVISSPPN